MQSVNICPVCEQDDFRFLFQKKGRKFYECRVCKLQRQFPLPSLKELADYYERSYRTGMYESFAAEKTLKRMTAERRLRDLSPLVSLHGRWCDVGAANGVFVQTLIERGVAAEGVELSDSAVQSAAAEGIPIHHGVLEDLPPHRRFDVITAFDLIEHLVDPSGFVEEVRKRLTPGGYLVMSLPNLASLQRICMRSHWYFYIPEEHLHYFAPSTMRQFLTQFGFEVIKIKAAWKPMTFDYAQMQLREFNPLIHRMLELCGRSLPAGVKQWPVGLPIGEMLVVARNRVVLSGQSEFALRRSLDQLQVCPT